MCVQRYARQAFVADAMRMMLAEGDAAAAAAAAAAVAAHACCY